MAKGKYKSDLPKRLYRFFKDYSDTASAPSFSKFAMLSGFTVAELEKFRDHKKFDEAYRECLEIRRDYLIDRALTKRFDASICRTLLEVEAEVSEDGGFRILFEVEK